MLMETAIFGTLATFVVGISGHRDEHRGFTVVVVAESRRDPVDVHAWQPDVEQYDVRAGLTGDSKGVVAVTGGLHLIPAMRE